MEKYSFVIPCYRSELTLQGVYKEICAKMAEKPELDYEIIAVNDFSPDNVYSVIKELASSDKRFKGVDLTRNGGKHAAILAGYGFVTGDIIINLDDDGQCPLDRLWDLIAPLSEGYDISIAKYPKKKESAFKRFGSAINGIMARHMINKPKNLQLSNFSAVKRFVVDEMIKYHNPYPYIDGLMLRTSSKIKNVEMQQRERETGSTGYTFMKSISLWMNGFTAFSVKPLRVALLMGMFFAAVGFVLMLFMIIRKLINPDVLAGYSSLMAVLLFIGGLMMIMLGLIGEYVGRIYISINNSPQYVVRETINTDKDKEEVES